MKWIVLRSETFPHAQETNKCQEVIDKAQYCLKLRLDMEKFLH